MAPQAQSPPAQHPQAASMTRAAAPVPGAARVDFYLLPAAHAEQRLRVACRIAEKACLSGARVFAWLEAGEQQRFDELLWSFADRSFVPHEPFEDPLQWTHTPVLFGAATQPAVPFDLLLNLAEAIPAAAAHAQRIAEVIDGDPQRRRAGRARFRQYRERGLEPAAHELAGSNAAR